MAVPSSHHAPRGRVQPPVNGDIGVVELIGSCRPAVVTSTAMAEALEKLGSALDVADLAARFIDAAPGVVGADVVGVYLFDGRSQTIGFVKGASEATLRHYE